MKKGQEYKFSTIEEFANENNYSFDEYGVDHLGENFIVLKHNEKDLTITFVLTSAGSNGYQYECVYSDI